MKYKALVFDFFGVISTEVSHIWLPRYFSEEESAQLYTDVVLKADRGIYTTEEAMTIFAAKTQKTPQEVENEWRVLAEIKKPTVSLLEELQGHYRIGLCSNATENFLRPLLDQHNLTDLFDEIVISSEVRFVKPEPEIYMSILKKLDVEPEVTLMIDDNPRNVLGAEKVGMHGVKFESAAQVRGILGAV